MLLALDTNTISYAMRGMPEVTEHLLALSPVNVAVPAIVVYELRYGLQRLPREAAAPRLSALLRLLAPMTVLDFDEACAQHAAMIRAGLEAAGTPIGPHDILIAATALAHQATLVTHNTKEFKQVPGLSIEDWLDGES